LLSWPILLQSKGSFVLFEVLEVRVMARKMTVQKVFKVIAACALASALFVACKGEEIPTLPPDDTMPEEDSGANGPGPDDDGGTDLSCLMPRTGCPCGMEGAMYDCRAYYYVNENTASEYVACSYGHYYCTDGRWGECIGERIVVVPPNEIPPGTLISSDGPPPQEGADAGL
jgi:hypothetical protein